jgi:hypothetical protein
MTVRAESSAAMVWWWARMWTSAQLHRVCVLPVLACVPVERAVTVVWCMH